MYVPLLSGPSYYYVGTSSNMYAGTERLPVQLRTPYMPGNLEKEPIVSRWAPTDQGDEELQITKHERKGANMNSGFYVFASSSPTPYL
jgi:hypothetical protein